MSAFTGPLTITELDAKNGREWELASPLIYEVGAEGSGRRIAVPAGFETDGASIPRVFWWLLPAWGRYSRPACVHDYLCDLIVQRKPHPEAPTATLADAIFYEAMTVTTVALPVRFVMWLACRLWAWLRLRQTARIAP